MSKDIGGPASVMLHSGGERRSVIGGDFGKKSVERWIDSKGSRENELRDAELLVVVAVCQRSPTKS